MTIVRFTPKPRYVTQAGPCDFGEVMEIRGYRSLHLTLQVVGFDDATSPLLWVAMETSLRPDRDWGSLGRFGTVSQSGGSQTLRCDHFMLFVRWNVVRFDGASAAWFNLEGVASTGATGPD